MSIVHKSRSGQTAQDLLVPDSAAPVMARSATPPPFQLIASGQGMEEEAESAELLPEKTDDTLSHADGDSNEGPPAAGNIPPGDGDAGNAAAGAEGGDAGGPAAPTGIETLGTDSGGEDLPELLKANVKTLTGQDLSGVKVNYNSSKPKLLGAGGYARGRQIELAAGQEAMLGTAVWAIVQQMQGKVAATKSIKGLEVNDDTGLETEARTKGGKAAAAGGRLLRVARTTAQTKAQGESETETEGNTANPLGLVIVPGSFREIDENGNVVEPVAEEVELEPYTPAVPENTVVDVPEVDLTLGYDNLKDITKGSIADTLGVSLDFLRSVVFDLTAKFSFYLGIEVEVLKGLFGVEGGFLFEAAASLNQQDDRLVRAGWTVSYGGKLVTTILWFIKNENTWLHSFGKLSVYQDMAHFSAHQFTKMSEMVDDVADETGEIDRLPEPTEDNEGRDWDALRATDPTDVHVTGSSRENTLEVGASVPGGVDFGAGFSASSSSKEMNFYRGEGDDRETRTATQEDQSYSGTLSLGRTEATLTFTDSVIGNHANEDNDGHYHNWSLSLKNPPSSSIAFINKFGDAMDRLVDIIQTITVGIRFGTMLGTEAWGLIKDAVLRENITDPADADGTSVKPTSSIDHYYNAEFNFVDSQDEMALQYLRLSKGTTASVGVEAEIPVFTNGVVGVNIHTSASASIDFSSTLFEVTSGQTITYFMTVYNGMVYTDEQVASGFAPSKDGGWVAFRAQHRPGIQRLLLAMSNPESVPYKEVSGYAGDHPNTVPLLLQAAQAYLTGAIGLDTGIAAFEAFLAENFVKKGERASQNSWDEAGFEEGGRTPWAKVASGSSEYTATITKEGEISVNQNAFQAANETEGNHPDSLVTSLMQSQDVKCNLKIPYYEKIQTGVSGPRGNRTRTYAYNHTSDKSVDIPKLTNRLQAAESLKGKFREVWGNTPFKIPRSIRNQFFNASQLTNIISEVNRLENLGRTGHPRRRNGYKAQARSKAASYFGEADEQLNQFLDVILVEQDPTPG